MRPSRSKPWFGGKSRIAAKVWARFGDVPNLVEPFFGSGAVLLARPNWSPDGNRIETVNDLDCHIANFWRALQADPEGIAYHADWPVNECDLFARHVWLVKRKPELQAALEADPDYYDTKAAGWWVWGICCWIGSGWCSGDGPWSIEDGQLVHLGDAGRGVNRQLVHLGNAGRGVNRKLVHLGNAWRGVNRKLAANGGLLEWMQALAVRLKRVRVCCGDWSRVCGETPTVKQGTTAVFLDPPYSHEERAGQLYSREMECADAVREWAIANGGNRQLRIAICGYFGEHEMPSDWECLQWTAHGGYGSQAEAGRGRDNKARECAWFSPHCIRAEGGLGGLFADEGMEAE